eukprot:CAMPEP_0197249094 /NCGR_PEP_ID=MMETSP1429-20130617/44914_1 /TAXON_ID=49237 /ORGANISM="Chaetoceros  sp., Strain UNC1202" /LENGTH=69 /DNA_ID=CAMNT_0042710509 /DNA_START=516 /DNA_END=725 /DNA_ORIENTATION=+
MSKFISKTIRFVLQKAIKAPMIEQPVNCDKKGEDDPPVFSVRLKQFDQAIANLGHFTTRIHPLECSHII